MMANVVDVDVVYDVWFVFSKRQGNALEKL